MAGIRAQRRLAAILAADVVGYSRLMEQDEAGTALDELKAESDLAEHASLAWYVTIPEGAHLVAQVTAPCLVEVGARAGDGTFAGGLLAADQDRVDLSALAVEPQWCRDPRELAVEAARFLSGDGIEVGENA